MKKISRQAMFQKEQRARGYCPRCREKYDGVRSMCEACRIIFNAAAKERYKRLLDTKRTTR